MLINCLESVLFVDKLCVAFIHVAHGLIRTPFLGMVCSFLTVIHLRHSLVLSQKVLVRTVRVHGKIMIVLFVTVCILLGLSSSASPKLFGALLAAEQLGRESFHYVFSVLFVDFGK